MSPTYIFTTTIQLPTVYIYLSSSIGFFNVKASLIACTRHTIKFHLLQHLSKIASPWISPYLQKLLEPWGVWGPIVMIVLSTLPNFNFMFLLTSNEVYSLAIHSKISTILSRKTLSGSTLVTGPNRLQVK